MDELQTISAEITDIFNNRLEGLSTKQAETIYLCNSSMNLYMELGERDKAMWEARYTLNILHDIVDENEK
tara:strand:+ start:329 stop:538 length:210 start_codon:yes stop_codon:yes gene_type:complete